MAGGDELALMACVGIVHCGIHPTTTVTVEVTPTPTTVTPFVLFGTCTGARRARELASDEVFEEVVRRAEGKRNLHDRVETSIIANTQILGTSQDKRPQAWRQSTAQVLIKACSCLGDPATRLTATKVTATATVRAEQPAVTVTATFSSSLATPTVSIRREFNLARLVTSNGNLAFQKDFSGDRNWYYQSVTLPETNPPMAFMLYDTNPGNLDISCSQIHYSGP